MPVKITTAKNRWEFIEPTGEWKSLSLPEFQTGESKVVRLTDSSTAGSKPHGLPTLHRRIETRTAYRHPSRGFQGGYRQFLYQRQIQKRELGNIS